MRDTSDQMRELERVQAQFADQLQSVVGALRVMLIGPQMAAMGENLRRTMENESKEVAKVMYAATEDALRRSVALFTASMNDAVDDFLRKVGPPSGGKPPRDS